MNDYNACERKRIIQKNYERRLNWFKLFEQLYPASALEGMQGRVLVRNLLYGLSLEALFKALFFVKMREPKDNMSNEDIGRVYKEIKTTYTHNLRTLANIVNLEISDQEQSLCDQLTQFVEWKGRYPTSKNPTDDLGCLDDGALFFLVDSLNSEGLFSHDLSPDHTRRVFLSLSNRVVTVYHTLTS